MSRAQSAEPRPAVAAPALHTCEVLANEAIAPEHCLVTLSGKLGARARAGQFVQVALAGVAGALLPRPFSVFSANRDSFQVLSRTVGPGTTALASVAVGSELSVLGPLGHGFELGSADAGEVPARVVLVGGGVGVPPLHLFAEQLRDGSFGDMASRLEVTALIGAARAELLLAVPELEALGCNMQVSTDDGSAGHTGLVTDLLAEHLRPASIAVLACGPHRMLSAVASMCGERGVDCQVALEEPMACGFGVCLGCAVRTIGSGAGAEHYALVCRDGPVFDSREVVW